MNGTHIIIDHRQAAAYLVAEPRHDGGNIKALYLGCLSEDGRYTSTSPYGWGSWTADVCTLIPLASKPVDAAAERDTARAALHATEAQRDSARAERDVAEAQARTANRRLSKVREAVLNA